MTTSALLFSRDTSSFLFMIREPTNSWIPDLNMLNIHRMSKPRIYRIDDTTTYITVDNNGTELTWSTLDGTADIRQTVEGPWISNDEIYLEFPCEDITAFDTWIRNRCTGPSRPEWDDHLRPQADYPQRPPYIVITLHATPTAPIALQPLPSHISALLIANAVNTGVSCPITMDPITIDTADTTPCGHVFTATALHTWLKTHNTCPECRAILLL